MALALSDRASRAARIHIVQVVKQVVITADLLLCHEHTITRGSEMRVGLGRAQRLRRLRAALPHELRSRIAVGLHVPTRTAGGEHGARHRKRTHQDLARDRRCLRRCKALT